MAEPTRLLGVTELAERLGLPETSVRWMRHTGKGPQAAVIAGRLTFRAQDVEDWITAQFEAEAAETQGQVVASPLTGPPRSRLTGPPRSRGQRAGAA